jgi:hypothetical protein
MSAALKRLGPDRVAIAALQQRDFFTMCAAHIFREKS